MKHHSILLLLAVLLASAVIVVILFVNRPAASSKLAVGGDTPAHPDVPAACHAAKAALAVTGRIFNVANAYPQPVLIPRASTPWRMKGKNL